MAVNGNDDIERAVGRLADEREIVEVVYRYAHDLDYGVEDDWIDCFTDDAVWDSRRSPLAALGTPDRPGGTRVLRGRAELAQFAAAHTRPPEAYHKHVLYEPLVDVDGDGAHVDTYYTRIDAPATPAQKARLGQLAPDAVEASALAGEPITATLTRAPGNGAPIGGLKVIARHGWFAARPSGTENIYKIYAESFKDQAHLDAVVREAQAIVDRSLGR